MRLIDVQCRPVFGSTGHLSFEVYAKISPTASGIGSALGKMMVDGEHSTHTSPPPSKSLKDYISFFDKEVKPLILNSDFSSQQEIDSILLTLSQQSDLPSAFFSATSIAIAKAASFEEGLPLYSYLKNASPPHNRESPPIPIFNILDATDSIYNNSHTIPFLLIPSGKLNLMESLLLGSRVLAKTREICWEDKGDRGTAPQGGVLTSLNNCEEGFNLVIKAASRCGYHTGEDFTLGIDFEAEYFKTPEGVTFPWLEKPLSVEEQLSQLLKLVEEFPLSYVEDPFVNNETDSWCTFIKSVSRPIMIVGDKFFSASLSRKTFLNEKKPINSFVIKPTCYPTVTEILNTTNEGLALGWTLIVSHRTIDSDDTFLSHLATASGSRYMKAGGMSSMEHIGKYNELMRIFNV